MNQTFAQKAIARAAGMKRVRVGEIVNVRPDVALSHDNSAAIARIFRRLGVERVRHPERLAITLDHAVPAPTTLHATNHAEIRAFAAEQGVTHFFEAGRGICHQVVSEEALVWPGQLILGADSHTTHFGWLGAFGAGVGRSEMAAIWATGELWLRAPASIRIELTGQLRAGVTAKDLALWILRLLGEDRAAYQAIEFGGPGVSSLSIESRMVLPNMMAEAGAKSAYLPPDERVFAWLAERLSRRTGRPLAECLAQLQASALYPDPDASYSARLDIHLDDLEPMVARPHSPANVVPLSEVRGRPIQQAFLGTCTNGRLEDLAAAAAVFRANGRVHRVARGARLLVIPASDQVLQAALKAGYIQTFVEAGAMIGTPGCGPCMGNHMGVPAVGEVTISTGNRNFRGRMGTKESEIYLASPAVVAASAILGRIAAPEEVNGRTQRSQRRGRKAEGSDQWSVIRDQTEIHRPIVSSSHRPDIQGAKGRVWKYGDHVNTDVIFPGKYTYTLREPSEWAKHALEDLDPEFAANVQPGDIIVAGRNWGCGSSREQAVGCLKAAGVRIIIAKSFARIYYRNAVNNGLLPIVCPDAVDAIEPGEEVIVDVEQGLIHCKAGAFAFPPLSPALQAIIEAGGLIPMLKANNC
ncbi:MAG: homoaconitate hydratase family protein [Chloroflexi bacterium]|nr:homoaconitate hydratase family protein [Chloroflexota bacterium]